MATVNRRTAPWITLGLPLLLALVFVACWEWAVWYWKVAPWLLPAPSRILVTLWQGRVVLGGHVLVTLLETVLGFGLALMVGWSLAFLVDASPLLRVAVYPLLVASQTIPIVAIAPLLVIGFGFGLLPKVLVVMLVCFFPIVVNTVDGLAATDRDMLRLLQTMNAGRWQILRLLRIPAALPAIFTGLKLAVTYSVIGAVLAEWIGAQAGLGVYLARSLRAVRTDQVFVAALVSSALTLALFGLTVALERALTRWRFS